MEGIKTYLLGVIAAAVICGIVVRLLGDKGTQGAMAKLMTGLFLAFTVIRPVANMSFDNLSDFTTGFSLDAAQAAAAGEAMTKDALRESIKTRTEAYILDKAEALNAALTVEVEVSQDDIPIPTSIRLAGKVSPYAKSQLEAIITEDLGIDKEHQTWI